MLAGVEPTAAAAPAPSTGAQSRRRRLVLRPPNVNCIRLRVCAQVSGFVGRSVGRLEWPRDEKRASVCLQRAQDLKLARAHISATSCRLHFGGASWHLKAHICRLASPARLGRRARATASAAYLRRKVRLKVLGTD